MKIHRLYLVAALLGTTLFFSCTGSNTVRISGTVHQITEKEPLLFKRLDFTSETLLDTISADEKGNFSYDLDKGVDQPGYYYLYEGERRIASLILKKGDRVHVEVGTDGSPVSIEGSEESPPRSRS